MSDPRDENGDREPARHVPYDIDVEQALLGSVLVDNTAFYRISETFDLAKGEVFYDPLHQRLFEKISALLNANKRISPLTLHAEMKADPGLLEVGGHAYLAGLAQAAPAIPNVRDLARILRDLAVRRRMIAIGTDLVNSAFEAPSDAPAAAIADTAASDLHDAVHSDEPGRGLERVIDLAFAAAQAAEAARTLPRSACLSTGLRSVDEHLGGLYRGDLTMLGGLPSMGKSALAQKIAINNAQAESILAVAQGRPPEQTLFFSLEMTGQQLSARYISEVARIPTDRMRRGDITENESHKLGLAANHIGDLPLRIDGSRRLTVAQMRGRIQAMIRRSNAGVGMVVVDHLRFIKAANTRDGELDRIQQITSDLADIAKDLNVALLVVAHLNREFSKRENRRPVLSDLYGSSAIEQNADGVWFVHREEYHLARNKPSVNDEKAYAQWLLDCERHAGKAEIYAAKQRMGPLGSAVVLFEEQFARFHEAEDGRQAALDLAAGLGL